jgi:EAL domain-containing protein (putative c-di-GMP-specific phosphodiesterase class I)
LRQKASAARSPALKSVAAAASQADSAAASVESLGRQLREMLPARRLHSVSICDHQGNVLWLSEGALGPDEHSVVVEALGALRTETSLQCHEMALEDGRLALSLPVRAPNAVLLGIAMVLADGKSLGDDALQRMSAAPVRAVMLRLAVLLKPSDMRPPSADSTGERAAPAPAAAGSAPAPTPDEPISPVQVNEILEFELTPEDTGHVPVLRALADSASTPDAEMVRLEFITEAPGVPTAGAAAAAVPAAPLAPEASLSPPARRVHAGSSAPVVTSPKDLSPEEPRSAPAAPTAVANSASSAAGDPNLLIELVPFAKLRAGGQTRRFQILARMLPAARDPAAQDALVLQRLLNWLATHRAAWNAQPTGFTVNLSIATLEDERFAQKVAAALNSHGIAPETLGFEIAEPLCTQYRAQVERFIAQCEQVGAWVVIDDFSFDSQVLPLLRSKSLRLLKIDPKLTSTALKNKLSQALVVATVQAARVLGVHCAAQKVDSQASLQWLTAIGCDFAQGAVLGRAQSLDSIATLPESTGLTAHLRST